MIERNNRFEGVAFNVPTCFFMQPHGYPTDPSTIRARLKQKTEAAQPLVLRKAAVARLMNTTIWTVDRWVRRGLFPRPFFMVPGSPAVWRVRDIEAHIEKRRTSRRPKPPIRGKLKQFQQAEDRADD
jgi:predicted DNA-binding transcriptional regulator AlpA